MSTKPQVIVTRRLPDAIETRMMELFDCRLRDDDRPMSQAELVQASQECEVLVPTVTDRIGQAVARRARGFGLAVHYHNRRRVHPDIENELEATYWESLDQMLTRMDIISTHCPHTPATYHLLSARRLKLMPAHAYIVNTSRGEVIDENALARLIEAGEIAGAALDVFEHEPAINPKLLKMENVVLLPHMGSATIEGRIAMGEKVIINIKTFADGHTPPDRVLETMF